ncbi:MAG: type IV conjugative transfer system protein TraE [Gammaproteobacteria bacterium]|nr:type IV conjugative transfer system protein TraE [Gammaproteobacteria bacterium]
MRFSFYQKKFNALITERKFLLGLSLSLLLLVFLQMGLLFFKRERIILTPPEFKSSVWIERNRFSQSYLEEMALFFAHLLLDVSESNILPQGDIVLRYVAPESYGSFKTQLLSDENRLKKQQLSLQFYPQSLAFQKPLVVDIKGILKRYVGSKKISEAQETYQIQFGVRFGRLFLNRFEVIQSNQAGIDEEKINE